jgi:hypothetical protein
VTSEAVFERVDRPLPTTTSPPIHLARAVNLNIAVKSRMQDFSDKPNECADVRSHFGLTMRL